MLVHQETSPSICFYNSPPSSPITWTHPWQMPTQYVWRWTWKPLPSGCFAPSDKDEMRRHTENCCITQDLIWSCCLSTSQSSSYKELCNHKYHTTGMDTCIIYLFIYFYNYIPFRAVGRVMEPILHVAEGRVHPWICLYGTLSPTEFLFLLHES